MRFKHLDLLPGAPESQTRAVQFANVRWDQHVATVLAVSDNSASVARASAVLGFHCLRLTSGRSRERGALKRGLKEPARERFHLPKLQGALAQIVHHATVAAVWFSDLVTQALPRPGGG